MSLNFNPALPLESIEPAPYNPRTLSEAGFIRLQESLAKYGVVKPIIINGNGMIVAGHQRTRALKAIGQTTTPAVMLGATVNIKDEVQFNLFHNSVETDISAVRIEPGLVTGGYDVVDWTEIEIDDRRLGSATVVKEMTVLLMKYGPWGSIIADEFGNIIANSDYAIACKLTRLPLLVYRMESEKVEEFLTYLNGEYGVYDFTRLGVKTYNQFRAQPERLSGPQKWTSILYEEHVLPRLLKEERAIDFGAGRCAYPKMLGRKAYHLLAYEPHMRAEGTRALDVKPVLSQIRAVQADVEAHGLFPVVINEAVLNSTTSIEWQHRVLQTLNALLAKDGRLHISTRCMTAITRQKTRTQKLRAGTGKRQIEFLDKDNYGASFKDGVWGLQHFHSEDTFRAVLEPYFAEIVYMKNNSSYLFAECRQPIPQDPAVQREALELEFNMEYPGGYRHNRGQELVDLILKLVAERNA